MDYELYHDESLEGGYWHGMLLVPAEKKQEFLELLVRARKNTGYFDKIGIKDVQRKGKIYNCASAWVQIAIACLRSRTVNKEYRAYVGKQENGRAIDEPIEAYGLKFILLRESNSHKELNGYRDYASKIETTFRMGLKGGAHFLGSEDDTIDIVKIHFDGHEHYQRHVDRDRIVNRMYDMRDYFHISQHPDLIDDARSNHNDPKSQLYEDCQFLQLTDLLVGCFRTALGYKTRDIHVELALPLKRRLVDEYRKGRKRMESSRWFKSFVLSQCYLKDDGHWKFEPLQRNPVEGFQPMLWDDKFWYESSIEG
jgi:hypothetical protein